MKTARLFCGPNLLRTSWLTESLLQISATDE